MGLEYNCITKINEQLCSMLFHYLLASYVATLLLAVVHTVTHGTDI